MDIKEIKELLELIQATGIDEFEMEKSGVRLHIRNSPTPPAAAPVLATAQTQAVAPEASGAPAPVEEAEEVDEKLFVFTAPIVGTFYITPKPDAEPFVSLRR